MWTSTSAGGWSKEESRSPCFTAWPPPPYAWQVRQFSARRPHRLRRGREVHPLLRHAGDALHIATAVLVADQAVHVLLLREVEARIGPTVAGVALGAGLLVTDGGDAEVVEEVLLPYPLLAGVAWSATSTAVAM